VYYGIVRDIDVEDLKRLAEEIKWELEERKGRADLGYMFEQGEEGPAGVKTPYYYCSNSGFPGEVHAETNIHGG